MPLLWVRSVRSQLLSVRKLIAKLASNELFGCSAMVDERRNTKHWCGVTEFSCLGGAPVAGFVKNLSCLSHANRNVCVPVRVRGDPVCSPQADLLSTGNLTPVTRQHPFLAR